MCVQFGRCTEVLKLLCGHGVGPVREERLYALVERAERKFWLKNGENEE